VQSGGETIDSDLVLVGGGHAHVQLLRRWMMDPLPGVRLTVVVDRHEALYSGMVPGAVAGDYAPDELAIDIRPLASRAGARCIHAAATRIDPRAKIIELEGRAPIAFDIASLDVGSTIRDADLPGVREHAVATRPIGRFVDALETALERASRSDQALRIALVGAGAAGCELALCLDARLRARGDAAHITLLTASAELLPGASGALQRRLHAALERREIEVRREARVVAVEADAVEVVAAQGDGSAVERLPADLTIWATGAAAHRLAIESPLPTNDEGFVRVGPTLQVEGFDDLFAVGDCAALVEDSWVPRAGVYAVREGPYLDRNLRARLQGRALRAYRPQRDFLALLNLGQRRAIGGKWGMAFEGRWVWLWKDWIDRRFMRRFQVLDAAGRPAADFPPAEAMGAGDGGEEMECGGCAAKVGPAALEDALARLPSPPPDPTVRLGVAQADDVAAFETPKGDLLLATIDGFRAFTDDPWLVGRVAAINAVSDVQAKGGRPGHALALVTVPDEGPRRNAEALYQVLAGVRAALDPLGVTLVGGHSTVGPELFVALSITGLGARDAGWLPLDALEPGDALVLTKALGSGVLLAADMRGLATGAWMEQATTSLLQSNEAAAATAVECAVHASTDVSGFGLAGHLMEMLRASDVRAELELASLPLLPGVRSLLESGMRSTYHEQNAALRSQLELPTAQPLAEILFDPQTAGGLLIGVASGSAEDFVRTLHECEYAHARVIGRVRAPEAGAALITVT
jgi:selenide,water dikinase